MVEKDKQFYLNIISLLESHEACSHTGAEFQLRQTKGIFNFIGFNKN